MKCPTHIVDPSFQIGAGPTGPFDCTAHSCSDVVDAATCGAKDPGGRTIRLLSSEPRPDPDSPGLNLFQVAAVAADKFGVFMDVHVGSRALTWEQYERKRLDGRPGLIQIGYGPTADSEFNAGRGFRGNHCEMEYVSSTEDALADGRAPGVYDRKAEGPRVYPRDLQRRGAERLKLGTDPEGQPRYAGRDNVWCAFARDVVPDFNVSISPVPGKRYRRYRSFVIKDGQIVGFHKRRTTGFTRPCSAPRAFAWPDKDSELRFLVKITSGSHKGEWVHFRWAEEA